MMKPNLHPSSGGQRALFYCCRFYLVRWSFISPKHIAFRLMLALTLLISPAIRLRCSENTSYLSINVLFAIHWLVQSTPTLDLSAGTTTFIKWCVRQDRVWLKPTHERLSIFWSSIPCTENLTYSKGATAYTVSSCRTLNRINRRETHLI